MLSWYPFLGRTAHLTMRQLQKVPVLILSLSLSACGGQDITAESPSGPVTDAVSVVDNLRAAGAQVHPVGTVSQPFFTPQGLMMTVNGQQVQIFEFSSPTEADAVAETVSVDGSTVGQTHITWVAPPHFYKVGKVIVLYVGAEPGVLSVLEEVLGLQFAGR